MSQKVVAQGGNGGGVWNDGVNKGVKKVIVGRSDWCVTFAKFEYVKGSTVESHEHGTISQTPQEVDTSHIFYLFKQIMKAQHEDYRPIMKAEQENIFLKKFFYGYK